MTFHIVLSHRHMRSQGQIRHQIMKSFAQLETFLSSPRSKDEKSEEKCDEIDWDKRIFMAI